MAPKAERREYCRKFKAADYRGPPRKVADVLRGEEDVSSNADCSGFVAVSRGDMGSVEAVRASGS